ncbi:MAG: HU family DNA-binding protein [Nocardioidaceae bacterium]
MNKSQLIDALAARYEGNRKQAAHALESVIDTITREVARGEKVAITGFGSFEKRVRDARWVRNPRTGERIKAKKTAIPKFNAGAELKAVVSGAKKLPKLSLSSGTTTKKSASGGTAKKATSKTTATKAPAKKSSTTAKKSTASKTTASKTTASKTTATKAPAKKSSTAGTAKKTAGGGTTKKTSAANSTATSAPAKKTSTAKKAPAKKSTAKKTTAKKS